MNKWRAALVLAALASPAYAEDKAIGVEIDLADFAPLIALVLGVIVGLVVIVMVIGKFIWPRQDTVPRPTPDPEVSAELPSARVHQEPPS